ncbi:TerC family protein [Paraburkholderia tropica]|uniref:Tellurite resistance protein TerC n=2 Tax=Paraburkholderia TaxID=1822464 RepID=A0ABX5MSW0_9BURK|nr:TerC family protein [Paraburkholderia tropica]MDE1139120.1 TerC family protein [Paraburkholderia tropica]PXX18502.1 tellurite resistance protein TerC [Paraburkholderia tropica]PZW87035.1 tellurite resistance protein TerC [Paraburkholderia tropica]
MLTPILSASFLGQPAWLWVAFIVVVIVLLVLDLGVLHRDDHEIGIRESLWLSLGYITVGVLFGGFVWWQLGAEPATEYLTGYLIEKSLSLDNVFVIASIFGALAVPRVYQHRVLFWGIVGVLVLRALMVGLGAALVARFEWMLLVFGLFLAITGVKMLFGSKEEAHVEDSRILRVIRRVLPVAPQLEGGAFVVRRAHPVSGKLKRYATPLLVALLMIEFADLIFAVDSIPAIFSITTDPFIVYTSNIFAVLGLRALFFALAAMAHRFYYLKHALALVLVFIGAKIFLVHFIGKMPALLSLGVTAALLAGGVLLSLVKTRGGDVNAAR